MMPAQFLKGMGAAIAIGVIAGLAISSGPVRADDDDHDGDARVRQGLKIAPVKLDFAHKNRELVGLGSYIVNGGGDCNGCHSQGPASEFTPTGNPYLLMPPFDGHEKINTATYLGGGRDFGAFPTPGSPVHIISRNLTPDKTGLPIGGDTFAEFLNTIRTGVDPDSLHPSLAPNPPPFNPALLQVMPWPIFRNMSDHDLRAIYEYLSAVPCIAGPAAPNPLHHNCV